MGTVPVAGSVWRAAGSMRSRVRGWVVSSIGLKLAVLGGGGLGSAPKERRSQPFDKSLRARPGSSAERAGLKRVGSRVEGVLGGESVSESEAESDGGVWRGDFGAVRKSLRFRGGEVKIVVWIDLLVGARRIISSRVRWERMSSSSSVVLKTRVEAVISKSSIFVAV